MVGSDIVLKLLAEDEASDTIGNLKGNVDDFIETGRKGGEVLNNFKSVFTDLSNGVNSVINSASGTNLSNLIIGNASKAETGKALLENIMGGVSDDYNSLLEHIDNVTNENLVSMNMMMPALANFKAATGASNSQLTNVTNTMARFGTYVQATTGSTVLAQTAMNKLGAGITGSFAALSNYKITEESLKATGYWSGEADDIDGYLLAVDEVIGETDQLMKTNEGVDQLLVKQFSIAGKSIGNELLPGLKQVKMAFIDWNKSVAQSGGITPAQVFVGFGAGVNIFKEGLGILGTLKRDIDSVREGVAGVRDGFSRARDAVSNFISRFNGLSTVSSKSEEVSGSVDKIGSLDDGGLGEDISKTGDSSSKVESEAEKFDKEGHVNKLKNIAMKFVKAAVVIAGVFLLIAEVLVFVWMEMAILGEVGKYYSVMRSSIEAGINGIVAIAPFLAIVGFGVGLLVVALDKLKISVSSMLSGGFKAFVAIGVVFALISEVLLGLIPPLLALALSGFVFQSFESQILAGVHGVSLLSGVLFSLAPFLPLFVASVLLVSSGIGAVVMVISGSLAIGLMMFMLSEFILGLIAPLASIASLGSLVGNLQGVVRGSQAIRIVAGVLSSVEDACSSMVGISFSSIESFVLSGFKSSKSQLMALVEDGGVISGIKDFTLKFNSIVSNMPMINVSGVSSLLKSFNLIKSLNSTFKLIQSSFTTGSISNIISNIFLSALLANIQNTVREFSNFSRSISAIQVQKIDTSKITNLLKTSQSILKLKNTIDVVKNTVSSIGQASFNANLNSGIANTISGIFAGNTRLKPAFQQLLNSIDDISWFNKELSSKNLNTTNNINLGGTTSIVSQISNTIKGISTTLTNASTRMRLGGLNIGKSITNGIKLGLSNITSTLNTYFNTIFNSLILNSKTKGIQAGTNFKNGYIANIKGISFVTSQELKYTLQTLTNSVSQFKQKGKDLGKAVSDGYREGNDMHSPGIIARSTAQEVNYTLGFLSSGENLIFKAGKNLGENLTKGFGNPKLNIKNTLEDINKFKDFGKFETQDIETLKNTGLNYENNTHTKGITIINVSPDAVNVDARDITQKESQQIMIQAMESLQGVKEVRI